MSKTEKTGIAVKEAVEEYLKRKNEEEYLHGLQKAVQDPEFIKRTEDAGKFYYDMEDEVEKSSDNDTSDKNRFKTETSIPVRVIT